MSDETARAPEEPHGDPVAVVRGFQAWLLRLRCKARIEQVGHARLDDLRSLLAAVHANPKKAPAFGQAFVASYRRLKAEIANDLTATEDRVGDILDECFDTQWSTLQHAFDGREPGTPMGRMLTLSLVNERERRTLDRLGLKVRRREFEKPLVAGAIDLLEEAEAATIAVMRRIPRAAETHNGEMVVADAAFLAAEQLGDDTITFDAVRGWTRRKDDPLPHTKAGRKTFVKLSDVLTEAIRKGKGRPRTTRADQSQPLRPNDETSVADET